MGRGESVKIWLTALVLANPVETTTYVCLDDTVFTISASDTIAIVRFKDGEYRLPRRSSSLATKYASEEATLYLDGDFAAFVTDERALPGCYKKGTHVRRPH